MIALASTIVLAFVMLQAPQSASKRPPDAASRRTGGAREMTLALPHTLRKGETAWLLVEVGAIGHEQIELTTQNGQRLGMISPYGVRSGRPGGTYTIPVPAEAISHRRLALRMAVMQSGGAQRAPTKDEVKSVRLLIRRFKVVR